MVSSPYMICTPAIGNSRDGRYWVKFGDSSKAVADRLQTYDTYLPQGNRTASQLAERNDYNIDGKVLENQIFKATNPLLHRQAFTRAGTTEWYEVWPKDQNGILNTDGLEAVLHFFNIADQVQKAKHMPGTGQIQALVEWLHSAIPMEWRTRI